MNNKEFSSLVKTFCHQNNLEVNLRSTDGNLISTHSNMYNVAVVFTLSNWCEASMEVKGLTTFLGIQVSSGKLQFAHPNWKTYAQKIHQMVEHYDNHN